MNRIAILLLALCFSQSACSQDYNTQIKQYREQYIKDLLAEPRKPVAPADVRYIHFFNPDKDFVVTADFTPNVGARPFLIQTHSGKQKPYKEYGTVHFTIHDTDLTLHVYQSVDMINDAAHKDELFIPFNDHTNYVSTFAGGRYLELTVGDIQNGRCLLDFNKCYNPYCAYADGFSCPIPPDENRLPIMISAGEMMFSKHMQ